MSKNTTTTTKAIREAIESAKAEAKVAVTINEKEYAIAEAIALYNDTANAEAKEAYKKKAVKACADYVDFIKLYLGSNKHNCTYKDFDGNKTSDIVKFSITDVLSDADENQWKTIEKGIFDRSECVKCYHEAIRTNADSNAPKPYRKELNEDINRFAEIIQHGRTFIPAYAEAVARHCFYLKNDGTPAEKRVTKVIEICLFDIFACGGKNIKRIKQGKSFIDFDEFITADTVAPSILIDGNDKEKPINGNKKEGNKKEATAK